MYLVAVDDKILVLRCWHEGAEALNVVSVFHYKVLEI